METEIIAITRELEEGERGKLSNKDKQKLETLSGKMAAICYMPQHNYGAILEAEDKALNRFVNVTEMGHHDINVHAKVTVVLSKVSKMLAMVLNSLGEYSTNEKSGRYTEISGESEIEQEKYNKWKELFERRLSELQSRASGSNKLTDGEITKLAMENARYCTDVFSHTTTMAYTTSIKQWNYIYDWCERMVKRLSAEGGRFNEKLVYELDWLMEEIKEKNLYIPILREFKGREFEAFAVQADNMWQDEVKPTYGMSYTDVYKASFVCYAQEERHRTLNYNIIFDGESKEFYVPEMIKGSELENEWLHDMMELAENDVFPQGTLVTVIETGNLQWFLLKCTERLCGRAQLETCKHTIETLKKLDKYGEFGERARKELDRYIKDGKVRSKCSILAGCKDGCKMKDIENRLY